jgi:uncharacterized protein
MSVVLLIIVLLLVLDLAWWWWSDRRVRRLRFGRVWRIAIGLFIGAQVAGYLWALTARAAGLPFVLPAPAAAFVYIWHLVVLPIATLALLGIGSAVKVGDVLAGLMRGPADQLPPDAGPAAVEAAAPEDGPSRREVVLGALAILPPLLSSGLAVGASLSLDRFRVRELAVPVVGLPARFDGMVIAHVTDSHVGKFTYGKTLRKIAEAANDLRPDLIAFTGDLIDFRLDDLGPGLDMLKRMKSRYGLFAVEGNHDLFADRAFFRSEVKRSGIPLLLDESVTLDVRGQALQLIGLQWGPVHDPLQRNLPARVGKVLPLVQRGAFPILLAHHPHAFDPAAEAGLPLVVAGHTHGGQLMINERIGAGPVLFRYLSGLYRKANSALVVSNGVGNWLPVRMNAPAEIIKLTLHKV